MTVDKPSRARTPWLTIAVQVMGAIALYDGIRITIDSVRCNRSACLSITAGILATIWGLIALASGIRGRVGFIALVVAIVAPLLVMWVKFALGLLFLLIVFVATSVSKDRLAPYYRWHKEVTS